MVLFGKMEKNIVETTAPVVGKVVSAEIVTQPKETPVATPAVESKPAPVKEQAWTKNPPASIAKRAPKKQVAKTTTAPKKRSPAPK